MAKCKLCGVEVPSRQIPKHRWEVHPKEARRQLEAARHKANVVLRSRHGETRKPWKGGKAEPRAKVTSDIAEAQTVTIVPKTFTMSSVLLWQAREAAIREWNWPADISLEDFVDTYLYRSFKQRGIILGGYQVLGKD
ncbi:MAG: hypothetical protein KJ624_05465 [Chloroflexi bacterium]|nr:hypothetical protein [Chloroflexota bacterium]